ncbi:MAG: response regulator [Bacteroidota bacterium]
MEILLIEDDPLDAKLTNIIAKEIDPEINIVWYSDSEVLSNLLNGTQLNEIEPRLILLDIKLPKVDGLELLKKIMAHDILKQVPVVMFTSSELHEDYSASMEHGALEYLVKPMQIDRFRSELRRVILKYSNAHC